MSHTYMKVIYYHEVPNTSTDGMGHGWGFLISVLVKVERTQTHLLIQEFILEAYKRLVNDTVLH